MAVLSAETLEDTSTVNTQGLSFLVPSLCYNSSNPRTTTFTIWGLGSNTLSVSSANDGVEPRVGLYVDQVYRARPAEAAFDLPDLERAEILSGPQGTLFWENSTAFVISITSKAPTFEPEAFIEGSVGGGSFRQFKVSVSGPLEKNEAAGRLSRILTLKNGDILIARTGEDLIEDEANVMVGFGLISTFLGDRGQVGLTAFHTFVRNFQASAVSSLATAALRSYPSNIPRVRVS